MDPPGTCVTIPYDRVMASGFLGTMRAMTSDNPELDAIFSEVAGKMHPDGDKPIVLPGGVCSNCLTPCQETYQAGFSRIRGFLSDKMTEETFKVEVPECSDCTASRKTWFLSKGAGWLGLIAGLTAAVFFGMLVYMPGPHRWPEDHLASMAVGLLGGGLAGTALGYLTYGLGRILCLYRIPPREDQKTLGLPVKIRKRGNKVHFLFASDAYAKLFQNANGL
jgi:hypothetical protein